MVSRCRGSRMFGSQQLPTYADSTPAGSVSSSGPKGACDTRSSATRHHRRHQLHGPGRRSSALNDVALPWSIEVETDAPSMVANIIAQANSDFLGCPYLVWRRGQG
ncbi:conserved membrane family protein [Mycobacterium ulcerans str. Harvey]|uniref:Conserved membrane family protein n=1 Tax=Mycobacterium ulcerans str. Harvey TaxID=1299332 RepID=A0ABP3AUQ6_MYCUL|nr:conserved membrane family protein [Mycobacterium ulcerans str. Harvey]